jgi:hypothetical protein
MNNDEQIYIVETISTFRHTYYVKARCAEHAMDEVTCQLGNWDENFIEGSQNHVGEDIASVMEVDEDYFIKTFDAENDYMRKWTREKKLERINTIDYGDNNG